MAAKGGDLRFAWLWLIWGALWFMFYLVYVPVRQFGRVLPAATIAIGILTCWIPGLLMLTGHG